MPQQGGFYGPEFTAKRGVTQGGLVSPTKFNIAADSVVREWLTISVDDNGTAAAEGLGMSVADKLVLFYADDGLISSTEAPWLQESLNIEHPSRPLQTHRTQHQRIQDKDDGLPTGQDHY